MSITPTKRWLAPGVLPWAALAVCLVLLAASLLLHDTLFHGHALRASPPPEPAAPAAPAAKTITLPEGKWKTAGIRVEPARVVSLPTEVGVPGRIDANIDRRVDIRPRASGVIREVRATLGQTVKKGDLLASLDSADIGTARLNLRGRQIELATARTEADWKDQVAANVARLIPELHKGTAAEKIQKEYAGRSLGSNRALLLQAYTEYEIASHEAEKTGSLYRDKIVGEHPYYLTMHTREGAQAKFQAALEQVRYDAAQEKRVADQKVQLAEAAVIDAAQRLRILGVSESIPDLLAHASAAARSAFDEDVTAYRIVAPIDGTIISRTAVPSQKAELNDSLFTLADLTNVWVLANIPESDFAVLPKLGRGTIRLTAAAYPGRTFDAQLLSVGATVDPTTRTVQLQADTPNPDGLLKLGMFVRIVLDTPVNQKALTVPDAAIVEVDNLPGVFVPAGRDDRTFAFRPVTLGRESGGRRAITAGLAAGDRVAAAGAFFLKSELILQNTPEED